MKKIESEIPKQSKDNKIENQVQAVLVLLKGTSVKVVSERFKICRSNLYKLRQQAIDGIRREIENPTTKNKPFHNHLNQDKENKVLRWCERHPTLSSYQISQKLLQFENETVNPRTIQRIRKRHALPRIAKRQPPTFKAHRFTDGEKVLIQQKIKEKLFLGGERLAWDIHNQFGIKISSSTAKRIKQQVLQQILFETNPPPPKPKWQFYERNHPHRLWHGDLMEKVTLTDEDRTAFQLTLLDDFSRAYVFCDLFREVTVNTTIRAIIAAMQKYQTIPQALVFDNGSYFKGKLLQEFCRRLGVRLIHSSVNHPQTNGKLERAFRDDMSEFYKRYDEWKFGQLKRNLTEYVGYRNTIRGHYALKGRPSTIRLDEQDFFALPHILNNLEKFAWCERGTKKVGKNGLMRFFQRDVYINPKIAGQKIKIFETLEGLEVEDEKGKLYFLSDYKELICRPFWQLNAGVWRDDSSVYNFRAIRESKRLEAVTQILRVQTEENSSHLAVAQ